MRTRAKKEKKLHSGPASSDEGQREAMPAHLVPMAAEAGSMPPDQRNWGFEYKWDGVRAIAYWNGSRLKLESRNLIDVTAQYPEIGQLAQCLAGESVVLDGEIIALDEHSTPSFGLLQQRMHVTGRAAIARLVKDVPVFYMIFDLLHLGGRSTRDLPYSRRRELLEGLGLKGDRWYTPPYWPGRGDTVLRAVRRLGLEGVMAKRLDSRYLPRRSPQWLKIKMVKRQEFVIGGYTRGKGSQAGGLGALLVGYYDTRAGRGKRGASLQYAGGVGTGFTADLNATLLAMLRRIETQDSPFAQGRVRKDAIWVKPLVVAEVEFRQWTRDGILRQGAFKGLRSDKDPRDVVREQQ